MDKIIQVDQRIERLVTKNRFKNYLVGRSGITTRNILGKILFMLDIHINMENYIISEDIGKELKPYYHRTIKDETIMIINELSIYVLCL